MKQIIIKLSARACYELFTRKNHKVDIGEIPSIELPTICFIYSDPGGYLDEGRSIPAEPLWNTSKGVTEYLWWDRENYGLISDMIIGEAICDRIEDEKLHLKDVRLYDTPVKLDSHYKFVEGSNVVDF